MAHWQTVIDYGVFQQWGHEEEIGYGVLFFFLSYFWMWINNYYGFHKAVEYKISSVIFQ